MKLHNIDKIRYRKHLNIVIVIGIIALASLSLTISQTAIYFLTDREGSHFWLNISGVVIAMLIIASILKKYRQHEFLTEVVYVWDLKHQINLIHRKNRQLNQAVEDDNVDAMLAMFFYYKACRQLYKLDDNTITLSSLNQKSNELDIKLKSLNISLDENDYNQQILKAF